MIRPTENNFRRSEAVEKFDSLIGGIQYPLSTKAVPVETAFDTPGFAPDGAG